MLEFQAVKLILQTQLLPDRDQARKLSATMRAFNAAADWLAGEAFRLKNANKVEALRLQRADSTWLPALRQAYAAAGMQGYWRKWLEWQQPRIQRGRLNPFYLAQIYAS